MEKIIDVDFRVTWESAVFVRIGNGFRERVDGPDVALSELLHRWPSNSHPEYALAKRQCVDAIAHQGSPELAWNAFADAAVVAEVLA
ncbi:DUF982 domain-containing protein [Rhizobium sp.]|uniref:DUF982 domain-containing protein n=1 Tax=Rhizobium sp. TaxID=391 RepID=UPI000DDA6F82